MKKNNIYAKLDDQRKPLPKDSIEDLIKKMDDSELLKELNNLKKTNIKRIDNGLEGEARYELTIKSASKKAKDNLSQGRT